MTKNYEQILDPEICNPATHLKSNWYLHAWIQRHDIPESDVRLHHDSHYDLDESITQALSQERAVVALVPFVLEVVTHGC